MLNNFSLAITPIVSIDNVAMRLGESLGRSVRIDELEWAFANMKNHDRWPSRILRGPYRTIDGLMGAPISPDVDFKDSTTIALVCGISTSDNGDLLEGRWCPMAFLKPADMASACEALLERAVETNDYNVLERLGAQLVARYPKAFNPRHVQLHAHLTEVVEAQAKLEQEARRARTSRIFGAHGLGRLNHVDPSLLAHELGRNGAAELLAELVEAYPKAETLLGTVHWVCGKDDDAIERFVAGLAPERLASLIVAAGYWRHGREHGWRKRTIIRNEQRDAQALEMLLTEPLDLLITHHAPIVRRGGLGFGGEDNTMWLSCVLTEHVHGTLSEAVADARAGGPFNWRDMTRLLQDWVAEQASEHRPYSGPNSIDLVDAAYAFRYLPEIAQVALLRGNAYSQGLTFRLLQVAKEHLINEQARR